VPGLSINEELRTLADEDPKAAAAYMLGFDRATVNALLLVAAALPENAEVQEYVLNALAKWEEHRP
jgi:presenilin-like A22 family membrane protease